MTEIQNPDGLAVVEIEWVDSTAMGAGKWIDVEDLDYDPEEEQLVKCYTTGYLVKETDTEYRVIQSYHIDTYQIAALLCIPKVAVRNINILRQGDDDASE